MDVAFRNESYMLSHLFIILWSRNISNVKCILCFDISCHSYHIILYVGRSSHKKSQILVSSMLEK